MSLSPKISVPDCEYLLDRANAELDAADRSADERAKEQHRKLAGLYLDRVFGSGQEQRGLSNAFQERRTAASPIDRPASASLFSAVAAKLRTARPSSTRI